MFESGKFGRHKRLN